MFDKCGAKLIPSSEEHERWKGELFVKAIKEGSDLEFEKRIRGEGLALFPISY
jgi:hypothetical protein